MIDLGVPSEFGTFAGRARAVPLAWGVRHGAAQGGTDIKSKSMNNGMGTI